MDTLKHPKLVAQVMATLDKILHLEKGMLLEEGGVKLHPSEIHLLIFLHFRPRANASDIARRFSVTKGAVSQTLSRLEGKGVLIKGRNPGSPTELDLSLTEVGSKLTERAVRLKEAAEGHYDAHFSGLEAGEREVIRAFLERMQARFSPQ